jgi:glycosyltransferase involved in cell wall biosynthesis
LARTPRHAEPVLYICYLEIDEPLVETQVVAYLEGLAREAFDIHLLTFEKARHSPRREREIEESLQARGVRWHRRRYHKAPSLPATLYDIAQGSLYACRLCFRHGIGLVHGRSHVGAAMARLAARRLRVPFIFDLRGLLADEYVDAGRWSQGSLRYRLTKKAERHLLREADGLVVLTRVLERELAGMSEALGAHLDLEVIPCCVDTAAYRSAASHRGEERSRRGWQDRRVMLYLGKLGGWYLVEEIARFFATARRRDPAVHLQVLTQSDPASLSEALVREGVPSDAYSIGRSLTDEVPRIAAAADVGLSLIRPCPSKRSSSPTKVGEYLAAGLPLVTTPGIGDCDTMVRDERLGVTLHEFTEEGRTRAVIQAQALLGDPTTRERCQAYAERELSLAGVGIPRYARLYRSLSGVARHLRRQ